MSLVVESSYALVLQVSGFDMISHFPPEVKHNLLQSAEKDFDFMNLRSEQIFRTLEP